MRTLSAELELESERCRLRPPREADIAHIFSATRVPGFNDGMLWDPPETEAELHARHQDNLRAWAVSQTLIFSIERKSDAGFLGRIVLRRDRASGDDAWELGYWIHPRSQGQGYATEAGRALLRFAFSDLGASVVSASSATFNAASQRVLEKLGMLRVAFLPRGFLKRGAWVAEHRYALTVALYFQQENAE